MQAIVDKKILKNGNVIVNHIENFPMFLHYAVVFYQDDKPYVITIHSQKKYPYIVEYQHYICNRKIIEVRDSPSLGKDTQYFLTRYQNIIRRPYDLLGWNCEHVTDYLTGSKEFSWQVTLWGIVVFCFVLAVLGVFVYWISDKKQVDS